jgi:hypothetical protein
VIEKAFFIAVTVIDLVAAGWIIAALFTPRLQTMPKWHRVGLLVGCVGLLVQALRNIQFLTTGVSATDSELPLWALKDLGYGLIAFHSIWLVFSGRLNLVKEAEPMVAQPKKPSPTPKPAKKRTRK